MQMRNFFVNTHNSILLFSILALSCFSSNPKELGFHDSANINEITTETNNLDTDGILLAYGNDINSINNNIIDMNKHIQNNTSTIKALRDSIKIFQQIDISGDTTDKDIINSLIRIQSKLNLIEEKMFYSDSLYFNLLNDLVIIESQIEDLSQNIDNIADLSIVIESENQEDNINNIENYKDSYNSAVEYYMSAEYDKSLIMFKNLVAFDDGNNLSDNSQFWIAQIFYIQKKYNLAIEEYKKVSLMGDRNKAPDADYKIALSYFSLDLIDEAMNQFNIIIINYPNNIDLVKKSKKYIERYR